jgi:SAM-dependent methyltransferase
MTTEMKFGFRLHMPAEVPGARCVDSFIAPRIESFFRKKAVAKPLCLQLEPDAAGPENEAIRLRERGHSCLVALASGQSPGMQWRETPIVVDPFRLPFPDEKFQFILTGAFARMASPKDRHRLAAEFFRVCASPGAVLLTCANRYSPIDLLTKRLHWFSDSESAGLHELERLFADCSFRAVMPINLAGHFEWRSFPGKLAWIGKAMERYITWITAPERRFFYASPLNPVIALWLEK